MIIREENDTYTLTRQHDHALLSGELARQLQHFIKSKRADVLFAIEQHDRSWIMADAHPRWNQEKQRPYDFIDYPLEKKLEYYRLGLNETEQLNPYAGLLCSMHYTSFIDSGNTDSAGRRFLQAEEIRQSRLRTECGIPDDSALIQHFRLLQLCDNLSLYVCLNRPGVDKSDEHPFFRKGFKNSSGFNPLGQKNLKAFWPKEREIQINPSPFMEPFEVQIGQKHLPKSAIHERGLQTAYLECETKLLRVKFVNS